MSDQPWGRAPARLDRRAALARLGLAATAAYVAPLLTTLSTAEAASQGKGYRQSRRGSGCSGSGRCASGQYSRSRQEYRHGAYYSPYPPAPPAYLRPEARLVLPPLEIIVRP
jgi:hypothetical protein